MFLKNALRRSGLTALLIAAICLFSFSQTSFGQASAINGQIEGTITDPNGAVVPNTSIEILHIETGLKRTAQTNESGFFRAPVLPLGTYEVTVQADGFAPVKRSGVVLNAGTTATLNIQLTVSGVSNEIVVTSAAPVIEPGRTDLGSTLTTNQVENLPLTSRNSYNFILVQPNVSGHPQTTFGVPRKVNANGMLDRLNYQFDGNNNTQSDRAGIRLIPISNTFVGEVQQVNNGFAPEFGNTVGTVFNAVTKSGSNQFHGDVGYIFRRQAMNARPTLLAPSAPKPPGFLDTFYANLGGPVVEDKLFFFTAFEKVRHDLSTPVPVSPATLAAVGLPSEFGGFIPTVEKPTFLLGKIDYQINTVHRFSVRYNYFRNQQPYNSVGGLQVQSQSVLFQDRAHAVATQLVSVLSANSVNELRFQLPYRDQANLPFEASGTGPSITISGVVQFGAPTVAGFHYVEMTPELSDNFSYNWGNHSFKVGGSFRNIRDTNTAATFATYTFPSIAAYLAAKNGTNPKSYSNFTQSLGDPELKYRSNFYSFYGQDTWKIRPNVTLVYGLRYDLYDIPDAKGDSPYPASRDFRVDKNNFGPRLGISWAIGEDQKTVVRASGGIFYDQPQTDVYRRAILNNGDPQFFNISTASTTPFAPSFPNVFTSRPTGFNLPTQDITTVAPDFRTLYTSNFNVQVSREITDNLGINVSYLFTKGTGLPIYRNINLIPTTSTLADGRPIFGSGRIFPQFNNILQAESVGNSNYNGMNVTINRRLSKGYELFATYTWSHAIDNAPEQNVLDSGALLPQDATNLRSERGNSLADRRHAFTLNGVISPTFNIESKALNYIANHNRLSFVVRTQSGDMFNMGSTRNLNNDPTVPAAQQRPLFIGRNTIRGPKVFQVDLRYGRLFRLGERATLEFLAEGSNITNHPNFTGINTTATVDAAGRITAMPSFAPTSALGNRELQLGVKFTF